VNEERWVSEARDSYDRVAANYADLTRGAFDRLPHDRDALDLFARLIRDDGCAPVLDVGCGPGWLTGYLAGHGVQISGLDVSPIMVGLARGHHPGVPFSVGSMVALPLTDAAVGGLVCWYVLHHVPDADLPAVLAEFRRVLQPGSHLLIGGHAGEGSRLKTEGYGGHPMNVQVNRRSVEVMGRFLRGSGFVIDAQLVLDPYDASPTCVIFARLPPARESTPSADP
jgi:SAM-dependent methyltransferase